MVDAGVGARFPTAQPVLEASLSITGRSHFITNGVEASLFIGRRQCQAVLWKRKHFTEVSISIPMTVMSLVAFFQLATALAFRTLTSVTFQAVVQTFAASVLFVLNSIRCKPIERCSLFRRTPGTCAVSVRKGITTFRVVANFVTFLQRNGSIICDIELHACRTFTISCNHLVISCRGAWSCGRKVGGVDSRWRKRESWVSSREKINNRYFGRFFGWHRRSLG